MTAAVPPSFDKAHLALAVEQLDAAAIHALPFGAVRLHCRVQSAGDGGLWIFTQRL